MTGRKSELFAERRADAAVVSVLAPVRVAQFKRSANAPANLAELQQIDSWDRGDYVSEGGWATMPGSTADPGREVATACAEALNKLAL